MNQRLMLTQENGRERALVYIYMWAHTVCLGQMDPIILTVGFLNREESPKTKLMAIYNIAVYYTKGTNPVQACICTFFLKPTIFKMLHPQTVVLLV